MNIRVLVSGAYGKMGQETVRAIEQDPVLALVGEVGKSDDLGNAIRNSGAQVVVDFTTPSSVYQNIATIIAAHARPVVGTTGLSSEQLHALQQQCTEKKLGGVIAPNFSIGAILLMRFATEAARYYSHAEIIEMHHEKKEDAPSGTALKTAEMMAAYYQGKSPPPSKEIVRGARGAESHHIPIHAVRLPGLVACQEVILGGMGETLSIRHNTIHREAFMPGVCLACKKVMDLTTLVYGLDQLL